MTAPAETRPEARDARRFRARLSVAMMVVVAVVTAALLALNERNAEDGSRRQLEAEFHSRLAALLGAQEARQAAARERCARLARSVRIRAALAEDDVEDLYRNAEVELRDLLSQENAGGGSALHADFFRFLDGNGAVLPPAGGENPAPAEPWETQLGAAKMTGAAQQLGYLALRLDGRGEVLREIIATPVLASATTEKRSTLVLGFAPAEPAGHEIQSGIFFDGRLEMPALPAAAHAAVQSALAEKLRVRAAAGNSFLLTVEGAPHLVFFQLLNPHSRLAPAWRVGLFPLAESLARQTRLRWEIAGSGLAVLLAGLVGIWFLSARLARPVEQLAADSAGHRARREQAEAALVLTEAKYRSIFENAVEGIFLLSREGRYLSANPALARIHGCTSPAELVAAPAQFYAQPERAAEFLRRAETDGVVADFEAEIICRDGRRIWVSQNARAIRDPAGALLHFEGTLEEITGRKHAADALLAVNLQLEKALADLQATQQHIIQQERLRALGQMASGIVHDFNNALMPIAGFSELLLLRPAFLADEKKARGYLEIINTGARDAAKIVGRLREFYRASDEHDTLAPVSARQLAEQAVALTQPKWKDQAQAGGAQISVRTELADFAAVAGDEAALREVLTNLIFNAVDAMPAGGTLTLRTRAETAHGVLEIADTGTGMSEEVRARCLEPFFSTKGDRGTGLGLAMVFGIVQRHRGSIDIESAVGRGTTFIIRLPLFTADGTAPPSVAPAAAARPLHILLVDDEPEVREVLSAFLAVDGHTVETAQDGLDGLAHFRAGRFDLVLTDKAMPGLSGDQMACAIKADAPRMPVVLVTGFSPFLDGENIPGIDVLATKPITLLGLRAAIGKALELAA